jgi:hypothetical protein
MWITQVPYHYAAACQQDVVGRIGVQEHTVNYLSTEANGMVQFQLVIRGSLL